MSLNRIATIEETVAKMEQIPEVRKSDVSRIAKMILAKSDYHHIAIIARPGAPKDFVDLQYNSIVAAINYLEILDMIVDGVWIGLNILGPINFSHTTNQNHTVKLTMEAV